MMDVIFHRLIVHKETVDQCDVTVAVSTWGTIAFCIAKQTSWSC